MGAAIVSIVVAAVGAVLRFATHVHSATWNVKTIGDILMIVGLFGITLAALSWAYWDGWGFGGTPRSRRTTFIANPREPVYGPNGYARTSYEPVASGATMEDPLDPTRPVATVVEEEERSVF